MNIDKDLLIFQEISSNLDELEKKGWDYAKIHEKTIGSSNPSDEFHELSYKCLKYLKDIPFSLENQNKILSIMNLDYRMWMEKFKNSFNLI